jgi:hypothetical protein
MHGIFYFKESCTPKTVKFESVTEKASTDTGNSSDELDDFNYTETVESTRKFIKCDTPPTTLSPTVIAYTQDLSVNFSDAKQILYEAETTESCIGDGITSKRETGLTSGINILMLKISFVGKMYGHGHMAKQSPYVDTSLSRAAIFGWLCMQPKSARLVHITASFHNFLDE